MGSKCHKSFYLPGDNTYFSFTCICWIASVYFFFHMQCLSNQTFVSGVCFTSVDLLSRGGDE